MQNPKHSPNSVYVSTERLSLPNLNSLEVAGAGTFPKFSPKLRLTKPDCHKRSFWLLPDWFSPTNRSSALTYHEKPDRWGKCSAGVELRTQGRGQEFVLNCDHYPEAIQWLHALLDPAVP